MKRIVSLLLCALLLSAPVSALSAASYALYDPLTGRVAEEYNADVRRGMASTTKLMTALVAAERYPFDREVRVLAEWCGAEGSSMYLRPDEVLTVEDLLYGLLLCSGNDAAAALAGLDGDADGFVRRMNERAQELGMSDTHFVTPSGLDAEEHYSTAHDLCLLGAAVLDDARLRMIVGTKSAERAGRTMKNHNRLLAFDGVLGLKTGYTRACGRCLVTAMERQGRVMVAATLDAPDDWNDHLALYARAFSGLEQTQLCRAGTVTEVPMAGGGCCPLYVTQEFGCALNDGEQARVCVRLCGPRIVYPPVSAGEQWGTLRVVLDGTVIFETPVFYASDVPLPRRSLRQELTYRLDQWWEKRWG